MGDSSLTFIVPEESRAKIKAWLEKHEAETQVPKTDLDQLYSTAEGETVGHVKQYHGAIGGGISYLFTPTGLGDCITVQCWCGAEENVTDYDSW